MHENRFASGVAFVSGAASGIGRSIVDRLLAQGAGVVGLDLNKEALDALAAGYGDRFIPLVGDVRDEAAIQAAMDTAVESFGPLNLAFNVAGASRLAPITEQAVEDWEFTNDVVLKSVFLATKHAARAMVAHSTPGAIVNISSLNAHMPMYGGSAYASAKAGVEMFSRNAALELGRHGIRVNAVLPGLVATPMTQFFRDNETLMGGFNAHMVLDHVAAPEDIADPALFLASDEARYITGTSLVVDGGYEIAGYPDLSVVLG